MKKPLLSKKIKYKIFVRLCIMLIIVFSTLKYFNSRIMPAVSRISEFNGVIKAEKAIDNAVLSAIKNMGISSSDLYVNSISSDGRINSLSADTILINQICASISEEIWTTLEDPKINTISLPIGIVSGIDFLAGKGPSVFKVEVRPRGSSTVDYETSFTAAGINQTNFQVWLNVSVKIGIVSLVSVREVNVTRKIALVNSVIRGDVPAGIYNPYMFNTEVKED